MKVTLADIAQKTNVTVSTVQRALNGGGGVSEDKRAYIQQVANEMGYRRNFFASSLRRGALRVAVVYPDTSSDNRFYSHLLWDGVKSYVENANLPFLQTVNITYENSALERPQIFEDILLGKYGEIHGIVTRGSSTPEVVLLFEKLEKADIPVVLIGNDQGEKHRLCCVRSYEKMAGSLAADLLLNFSHPKKEGKVILCGKFSSENQFLNAQGFEQELWQRNSSLDIIKVMLEFNTAEIRASLAEMLKTDENIVAIYACSTQSTLALCRLMEELQLQDKVIAIGTDLFEESINSLKKNYVKALIDNRPHMQAYYSIQKLVKYLLNDYDRPVDTIFVPSSIVLQGNLDFHLKDVPLLQKYVSTESLLLYSEYQWAEY